MSLCRLLACLRIPHKRERKASDAVTSLESFSMVDHRYGPMASFEFDNAQTSMPADGLVDFDKRVLPIVKEAMRLGVLPRLSLDTDLEVNMTRMLPAVAEAYTFNMMNDIKRTPSIFRQEISIKVPAFDPKVVLLPSNVERSTDHGSRNPEGTCT